MRRLVVLDAALKQSILETQAQYQGISWLRYMTIGHKLGELMEECWPELTVAERAEQGCTLA